MSDYMASQMDRQIEGAQHTYAAMADRIAMLEAAVPELLKLVKEAPTFFVVNWSGEEKLEWLDRANTLSAALSGEKPTQPAVKPPVPTKKPPLPLMPPCPKCYSNSQVWVNQITGKLMCHRAWCYCEVDPHKAGDGDT